MIFEPTVHFPGVGLLLVVMQYGWVRGYFTLLAWAVLLGLAHWISWLRWNKVLRRFLEETGHATLPGRAPHVIAHSFGTYLTAKALREFGPTTADRIVLTGCVLHEHFDWVALLSKKQGAFKAIRNDIGRKDIPVYLAGLLHRLFPDFGSAGRYGFQSAAGWVHDVLTSVSPCAVCGTSGRPALLHNVFNDHGDHSTTFHGPGYAANYWLPFFWGIEPKEYDVFRVSEIRQSGQEITQVESPELRGFSEGSSFDTLLTFPWPVVSHETRSQASRHKKNHLKNPESKSKKFKREVRSWPRAYPIPGQFGCLGASALTRALRPVLSRRARRCGRFRLCASTP